MRVVDRKKVLPEVTIGLNKEETIILASVLSKSDLEKEFCHDLLTRIDIVLKDDDFREKKNWILINYNYFLRTRKKVLTINYKTIYWNFFVVIEFKYC